VPRGRASQHPARYEFDEEEYGRISKLAKLELDDANEDLEDARQALSKTNVSSNGDSQAVHAAEEDEEQNGAHDALSDDDDLREYDLENYDADEVDGVPEGEPDEEEGGNSIFGNIGGLAYYRDSKEDPYLKLPEQGDASDDEEREELQVLPTDNMVLAARIEDEVILPQ